MLACGILAVCVFVDDNEFIFYILYEIFMPSALMCPCAVSENVAERTKEKPNFYGSTEIVYQIVIQTSNKWKRLKFIS